ncbi:MAG: hypothetical protein AABW41_01320 [Nanoarchaeota archaeon]
MGFQVNRMLCMRHDKKIIGKCMWCGKQVCKQCDFKNEGQKFYCSECLDKISKTPRLKEKYGSITKKQL